MAQHQSEVVSTDSIVLATVISDTDMRGTSLTFYGIWHNIPALEQYISMLNAHIQWLRDNGVN